MVSLLVCSLNRMAGEKDKKKASGKETDKAAAGGRGRGGMEKDRSRSRIVLRGLSEHLDSFAEQRLRLELELGMFVEVEYFDQ